MRVISQKKIQGFYKQAEYASTKVSFLQWYHTVTNRDYRSFSQILADFKDTIRENDLYVFRLHNEQYYIVTSIYFDTGCIYVRFVGTASDYSTLIAREKNEAR